MDKLTHAFGWLYVQRPDDKTLLYRNPLDYAADCAIEDADAAISIVRGVENEPIVWLTSNRYFPPLREWGSADTFYSGSFWNPSDAWIVYVEAFEKRLADADVLYDCPEYDNSLYAVDLRRWEYVENADAESLSDEWRERKDAVDAG